MCADEKKAIWSDASGCRFFLIPEAETLVEGSFILLGLSGGAAKVDESWAKKYEVTAEQAQRFFKNK